MNSAQPVIPQISTLAALFYPSQAELGDFRCVDSAEMPAVPQKLLDHENHMTVTVEAFHRDSVDVQVLAKVVTDEHYARKILLRRRSDGAVVQYGIMRIKLDLLDAEVRAQIESEQIPLGRVLIEHNVLRQVELFALWEIIPGDELQSLLRSAPDERVYGRTALIRVDGEPAVELLEILSP